MDNPWARFTNYCHIACRCMGGQISRSRSLWQVFFRLFLRAYFCDRGFTGYSRPGCARLGPLLRFSLWDTRYNLCYAVCWCTDDIRIKYQLELLSLVNRERYETYDYGIHNDLGLWVSDHYWLLEPVSTAIKIHGHSAYCAAHFCRLVKSSSHLVWRNSRAVFICCGPWGSNRGCCSCNRVWVHQRIDQVLVV